MNDGATRWNTDDNLLPPREFSVDHTTGPNAVAAFDQGWRATIGDAIPLPTFASPHLRGHSWAGRVRDAALNEMHLTSPLRTRTLPRPGEDVVRLWAVRRGQWLLSDPYGRGQHTISAGQFLLQHFTSASHFETAPDTATTVLMLPQRSLKDVLGQRVVTGSIEAPEVRLLLAHVGMVRQTLSGLGAAGLRAAENTLVELATALVLGRFDDREAALFPALVGAARDLADARLTEAGLSSTMLARQLHVSVRTLQRAFADAGEPVSAYVRRRRLEEARRVLLAGGPSTSVAEVAARFQFADSSHFIRAYRRQFGLAPGADQSRIEDRLCATRWS